MPPMIATGCAHAIAPGRPRRRAHLRWRVTAGVRVAVPVVEIRARALHAAEAFGERAVLARVRVLADLGLLLRADAQVVHRCARVLTNWCGYSGPGGMKTTSPALTAASRRPRAGALAFEHDEHFFLRMVQVVGAAALAGGQLVIAGAELAGHGALGKARAHRVVKRLTRLALAASPRARCAPAGGAVHRFVRTWSPRDSGL